MGFRATRKGKEENKMHDRGCDWFCDGCGVKMNNQPRFTTARNKWKCKACGYVNDVS